MQTRLPLLQRSTDWPFHSAYLEIILNAIYMSYVQLFSVSKFDLTIDPGIHVSLCRFTPAVEYSTQCWSLKFWSTTSKWSILMLREAFLYALLISPHATSFFYTKLWVCPIYPFPYLLIFWFLVSNINSTVLFIAIVCKSASFLWEKQ